MRNREYHLERERQCRDMAERAADNAIRNRHIQLANLHHEMGNMLAASASQQAATAA